MAGAFSSGECFKQLPPLLLMTLDTQMTLALLQELLLALRANDAEGVGAVGMKKLRHIDASCG